MAGLEATRACGRKGGRPQRLDVKQQRSALAMMKNRELSVAEIGRHFRVSRSTLDSLQAASRELAE